MIDYNINKTESFIDKIKAYCAADKVVDCKCTQRY